MSRRIMQSISVAILQNVTIRSSLYSRDVFTELLDAWKTSLKQFPIGVLYLKETSYMSAAYMPAGMLERWKNVLVTAIQ